MSNHQKTASQSYKPASLHKNLYGKSAANAYQKAQVTTVDDISIVIMLYEGALRFLKQSIGAIENSQIEYAHLLLSRVKNIVAELLSSVDKTKGGKLADDLLGLYVYIFKTLVDANLKKDINKIKEVIKLMDDLLSGWKSSRIKRSGPKIQDTDEKMAALKNQSNRKSTSVYG